MLKVRFGGTSKLYLETLSANKLECRRLQDSIEMNWDKKINKAVFRGSATGCGINIDTNIGKIN